MKNKFLFASLSLLTFLMTPNAGVANAETAYTVASYLTDPFCKTHQLYRQISIADTLYPDASQWEIGARKVSYSLEAISNALFALISTPPGVLVRYVTSQMQKEPFLYSMGNAQDKMICSSISLLSWNICGAPAGYSITDGGVLPWPFRIDALISTLLNQNADIVCLYEVFDIQMAKHLINSLKDIYAHFYFNIGPNAIGTSSGMFIASKLKVMDPTFTPFPFHALNGRAKFCKKGVFSFGVAQNNQSVARIFSTHLQHSEIPLNPTVGEMEARKKEMHLILKEIKQVYNQPVVLTGDFNLDDAEFDASDWKDAFDKGAITSAGCTWCGDFYSATLTGKTASTASNLDYTLIVKDCGATISTSYVPTGFDQTLFNPQALSDHQGLFSLITLNNR